MFYILTILMVHSDGGDDGSYGLGVLGSLAYSGLIEQSTLSKDDVLALLALDIIPDYVECKKQFEQDVKDGREYGDYKVTIIKPHYDKSYCQMVSCNAGEFYFKITPAGETITIK